MTASIPGMITLSFAEMWECAASLHRMRQGQVFNIDGTKFFTFGGAYSVGREDRAEGISWFPEEIPTEEEYEDG